VVVNTNEEWMIACDTAELAGLTRSAVTFAAAGERSGRLDSMPTDPPISTH
jgi:hypothetical protein